MYQYFGHGVHLVRRGKKNSRIRFGSGRTKLVPNDHLKRVVSPPKDKAQYV